MTAKPGYRGLAIQPCIPSHWPECRILRTWRGADYDIHILNPNALQSGRIELTLEGEPLADQVIPNFADGKIHHVVATIVS